MPDNLTRCILELVQEVSDHISAGFMHGVYETCNALVPELSKINEAGIRPEDITDFVKAKRVVQRYAKDIRGVSRNIWPSARKAIEKACSGYVDPDGTTGPEKIIASLCGHDFVEYYDADTCKAIIEILSGGHIGDVEFKRKLLAALWRFYEPRRTRLTRYSSEVSRFIGTVSNELSVRHENEQQRTGEVIERQGTVVYDKMLSDAIRTFISLFAMDYTAEIIVPSAIGRINNNGH